MKHYDLLIIGAGPVGLAAAYFSAKRGLKVLVIEQHDLLNQLSSSSGATRQFRLQYSEEYMSRLCINSIPYWDEIQAETSEVLRTRVGSLWFGVPESNSSEGEIKEALKTMEKLNISYSVLNNKDIENNFSFKNLPEDYVGFFQKDGGTINVPATINTLKRLCDSSGLVDFTFHEEVINIEASGSIRVKTRNNVHNSEKLLVCAGAYSNRVLKHFGISLHYNIWQMVSAYFKIKDTSKDLPSWFVYENTTTEDPGFYYGFENCSWDHPGFLRIAPAYASDIFDDPARRRQLANTKDLQLTVGWVKKRLSFVEPSPSYISTCLASIPYNPHKKMYLDFLIKDNMVNKNIVIFSSGWAFKFVPLLGKICSDLIKEGKTNHDISHFSILDDPNGNYAMTGEKEAKVLPTPLNRRLPF